MTKQAPPNLNDMFVAGLPLRLALELETKNKEDPSDPEGWWVVMRRLAETRGIHATQEPDVVH